MKLKLKDNKLCIFCCKVPVTEVGRHVALLHMVFSAIILIALIIFMIGVPFGKDIDIYITHIPISLVLVIIIIYSLIAYW